MLSDQKVWDGPLAQPFRGSTWPKTKSALDQAKVEVVQFRGPLNQIEQSISPLAAAVDLGLRGADPAQRRSSAYRRRGRPHPA